MLTFTLATHEQYDEFLQLMLREAADYLPHTMELMQITLEQFQQLVATTGQVYAIYQDKTLVGFYWIEERGRILHLHGLVLASEFQGTGIGSRLLTMLAAEYGGSMAAIELGVHESNVKARALYERLGYQTMKHFEDLGFYIMQRRLA